jgi:hypothetical protein
MSLDILEWCAIEEFKRGNPAPLVEWWKRLKGEPSPLLQQFILALLEGKLPHRRGRPMTPPRWDILTHYTVLRGTYPSELKEEHIKLTADVHGVGIKTVERIIYRLKRKPSPRLPQK